MQTQRKQSPTEEEIERALIACLRIAAARGRQLREERERINRENASAVNLCASAAPDVADVPKEHAESENDNAN